MAVISTETVTDTVLHRHMIEAYARCGWVTVPRFYSAAETCLLQHYMQELSDLPEVSGAQMIYREQSLLVAAAKVVQRLEDFCPHHVGMDELVRRGRLVRAVEELLGADAVLFKDKINYKASGGAGFEPHQDQQAGWSRYAPLFITALVSNDEATEENGCLQMSDTGLLDSLIGEEWKPLTEHQLRGVNFVCVPTQPGDVVFFDSYAVHRSGPNLSNAGRRVLYVTYNRAADGDHRAQYYADKRASFPPDIDRQAGVEYKFRV